MNPRPVLNYARPRKLSSVDPKDGVRLVLFFAVFIATMIFCDLCIGRHIGSLTLGQVLLLMLDSLGIAFVIAFAIQRLLFRYWPWLNR